MLKSFKKKLMTKTLRHRAMHSHTKLGSTRNKSRLNQTRN